MTVNTTSKGEWETIWDCLIDAIKRFNGGLDQKTLLQPADPAKKHGPAAGERAIAHRLAYYLECELRKAKLITDEGTLIVDCEYNRHGGATKSPSGRVPPQPAVFEPRFPERSPQSLSPPTAGHSKSLRITGRSAIGPRRISGSPGPRRPLPRITYWRARRPRPGTWMNHTFPSLHIPNISCLHTIRAVIWRKVTIFRFVR